jgi:hypothetical protein
MGYSANIDAAGSHARVVVLLWRARRGAATACCSDMHMRVPCEPLLAGRVRELRSVALVITGVCDVNSRQCVGGMLRTAGCVQRAVRRRVLCALRIVSWTVSSLSRCCPCWVSCWAHTCRALRTGDTAGTSHRLCRRRCLQPVRAAQLAIPVIQLAAARPVSINPVYPRACCRLSHRSQRKGRAHGTYARRGSRAAVRSIRRSTVGAPAVRNFERRVVDAWASGTLSEPSAGQLDLVERKSSIQIRSWPLRTSPANNQVL